MGAVRGSELKHGAGCIILSACFVRNSAVDEDNVTLKKFMANGVYGTFKNTSAAIKKFVVLVKVQV